MWTRPDVRLGLKRVILEPGDCHVAEPGEVIVTILGSCVGVCLRDSVTGLVGLNHFMLPELPSGRSFIASDAGRYGMYAMELLVNQILARGGQRGGLEAKVFGAARVVRGMTGSVADGNLAFARFWLGMEGIPVKGENVGGVSGRRVWVKADGGVKVETLRQVGRETVEREEAYRRRVQSYLGPEPTVFKTRG